MVGQLKKEMECEKKKKGEDSTESWKSGDFIFTRDSPRKKKMVGLLTTKDRLPPSLSPSRSLFGFLSGWTFFFLESVGLQGKWGMSFSIKRKLWNLNWALNAVSDEWKKG